MKVKHSVAGRRRHKKVLKAAKGYWGRRSKHYRRAIETLRRALVYAYRDRRAKKREFRSLWMVRINAAVRQKGLTYSEFMHRLKIKKINLSRDILAKIAAEYPDVFEQIIKAVQGEAAESAAIK